VPRLLVVSYHFPPTPGVAPARVGKLVKYLRRLGWEPSVVSGDAGGSEDPDLLADVAGVPVAQVRALRGVPSLQRLDWAVAALAPSVRLARRADVVLISGGPFAPFLLGPALRRPYVLDLRDPWSWEPRFGRLRGGWRRRTGLVLERRLESVVLRRAAAVVTVAPELAAAYERQHPSLAGRIHVVRHGFDPEDFSGPEPGPPGTPTLVHVGTMQRPDRTPELLLAAAALVRARGRDLGVRLVGPSDAGLAAEIREDWVDVVGRVPRRTATAEMRRASILWLEPGQLDFLITGKVYEYLAAGRPIVAVAPASGSVARLLEGTGGAVLVQPRAEECAAAIERALAGDVPARDEAAIARLAQPGPARDLAAVLDAAREQAA